MNKILKRIKALFSFGKKKEAEPTKLMISYLSSKQEEIDRFKRQENKIKKSKQ